MSTIASFKDLLEAFRSMHCKKRIAIVCPTDEHTRDVALQCASEDLAEITLIHTDDDTQWCRQLQEKYPQHVTTILAGSPDDACRKAVAEVRQNKADVIMKGLINTDNLLRAVLDKEHGILRKGNVMTHLTAAEIPGYDHLLLFSDAAVIPYPDLTQMDAMVRYGVNMCRRLGSDTPNVALIHFTEKTSEKFPYTIDYATLKERAYNGDYGSVHMAGPMDVKSACDAHSAQVKGIESDVTGHADMLIFPNLTAANTFYKTLTLFGHSSNAAIVCGADAPIVVPSRADSAESKFYSLALACVAATSDRN